MSGMFAFPEDGSDGGGDIGSTIFDPGSVNLSNVDLDLLAANMPVGSGFFDETGKLSSLGATSLLSDPELLSQFKAAFPEDAAALDTLLQDPETKKLLRQQSTVLGGENAVANIGPQGDTGVKPESADTSGIKSLIDQAKKAIKDVTGLDAGDAAKYAAMLAIAKMARDDAEAARKEARGWEAPGGAAKKVIRSPSGVRFEKAAQGGVMSLQKGGSLQDEMIAARGKQLNPATGPQAAGADYARFAKSQAEKDITKFVNDLKNLGLTDPEALEVYASNFGVGPIYRGYDESGLDFSPRLNARTEETANTIRALAMPSAQARSDYEANISELMGEPTYDIGIPQLYEGNMPASMLNPEYEFSGNMSNADLSRAGMPQGVNGDEEELGSSYSGLASLQALKMGEDTTQQRAAGGVMSLGMAQGRYLDGHSDGMADKVPAHIEGKRPAALSDGEFVIPADVVSHLGNGNSNAGAKRLYEMMDRIRGARTGNTKQGKQINPNKFLPR
jgi:hypothetical protein